MKKYFLFLMPAFVCLWTQHVNAQKTGNFEETVLFNSENRTLACYVPQDYDSTAQYQLIIALHGLGDNAANYRNALINSLKWQDIFLNTIIVCPDGGSDQNKDFYTPDGDEAIIQKAIDFASNNYTIDPAKIVLQGFSMGGRAALKFGLENTAKFKGLILNTPAVQGIADANNNPALNFGFDYSKASEIPIFLCFGGEDLIYVDVLDLLINKLIENNAILYHEKVVSLAHQIAGSNTMNKAQSFIDEPASAGTDLDVHRIIMENYACSASLTPSILFRNTGKNILQTIEFTYGTGGNATTYTWNGALDPFEHALIQLPAVTTGSGLQTLSVTSSNVNNGETEITTLNNTAELQVFVAETALTLPYAESFEGNIDAWTNAKTYHFGEWYVDSEVASDGSNSISNFNSIFIFYNTGYEEHIRSPKLDLSSSDAPSMSFDVAYNFTKYTPPYFTADVLFADTLIVSVSTDCGQTFTELFKKGGKELATVKEPILNPLNVQSGFFNPKSDEWRREAINLSAYKASNEAIIQFTYKSALGGNIYIDNVKFDRALGTESKAAQSNVSIFPNPANSNVFIEFGSEQSIQIYDALGKLVYTGTAKKQLELNVQNWVSGVYHVRLQNDGAGTSHKFIVAH